MNAIPGDTWLHDAVLKCVTTSPFDSTVVLHLDAYETPEVRQRKGVKLVFSGVTAVTTALDFTALADNASAGNVQNVVLSSKGGTSFVYLIEGFISISASTVAIDAES